MTVSLATNTTTTTPMTLPATKKNIKMEFFSTTADVPSAMETFLDEWLANESADLPSLFSSPSLNGSPDESPLMPTISGDFELSAEPLFGTPLLGDLSSAFSPPSSSNTSPHLSPASALKDSSTRDTDMSFFSDLETAATLSPKITADSRTPAAALVAHLAAAAAFNIPWGTEPAVQQVPLHPIDLLQEPAALAAAKAAAEYRLSRAKAAANPSLAVSQQASKRRSVDLDDLDPKDEVALKRAKNTDAARRSRMKKVMKMEGLERRVAEFESENSKLVLKVAVLESEKASGEVRDQEYERRIKRLEDQLREAHKAMLDSRSPKE